ncbi:MAG: flippase [Anaerolineae bacterium]|jgi:PST family polysaccharide transporter|nr:MAG: flippase [Anaerolineae bacterium]
MKYPAISDKLFYKQLRSVIHDGLKSSIVHNAVSLYLMQFANYLVPLIMVPYLVRVLGPTGFGAVSFAQGFINYLMLFVEYGFDLSATRKISVQRENLESVNRIALHVWAAKGLLSVVGFAVLIALMSLVPTLGEVRWLLLALYGLVLGNALFPTWLFQGMERMVTISVINLGLKLSILAGVFLLVKQPEDAVLYAGLLGGGSLLAGLTGAVVAFWMLGLRIGRVSASGVWEALKDGWLLFLSKASVSLYTAGNAFILGMLTNHAVVGYYSAAEKIVRSLLGLLSPISQAAYPRFSKLAAESKEKALIWGRRMLLLMGSAGFAISLGILVGVNIIVSVLLGSEFGPSVTVMRILAFLPFLIALSNVLGIQLMIPFGKDRTFTLILFGAGVLNVCLAVLLTPKWHEKGMAVAVLLSEIFVTLTMFLYLIGIRLSLISVKKRYLNTKI